MRTLFIVFAILFVAGGPRNISAEEGPADLFAPTAEFLHRRTSWYIGENIGYSWGKSKIGYSQDSQTGSLFGFDTDSSLALNGGPRPQSATGGVQGGYDYQAGRFVYGLVADFDLRRGRDQSEFLVGSLGDSLLLSTKHKWHGTLRGRIGFYPSNAWLIYTTGGFAYGSVEHSVTQIIALRGSFDIRRSFSSSREKVGWTVGTGAEYQFSRSWSAGIEYSYTDLGTDTVGAGVGAGSPDIGSDLFPVTRASYDDAYHVARVMLNFRFGGSR